MIKSVSKYEEKKKARIERYKQYSENAEERSQEAYCSAKKISDMIPMGQPILVGHHSECSHRADIKRIDNGMRKSINEQEKSEYWKNKADNPEAINLINNKIARILKSNEFSKEFNARLRKYKTWQNLENLTFENKDFDLKDHVSKRRSCYALPPDSLRAYYLNTSRNSAEIKRLKDRIKTIENSETIKGFIINKHEVMIVDGQIQVHCDFKPNEDSRKKLKSWPLSLKWSRYSTAWGRKLGPGINKYFINELKKTLSELTE